jgi:sodium transport system ATP-binding protein
MLDVRNLTKRYLNPSTREVFEAVSSLTFSAKAGEVFGLLGPNGAGKTTTLRMLSTLIKPDEGTAVVAGHDLLGDPAGVRSSIGYLSTTTGLYDRLTARELITYFGRLQGVVEPVKRTEELLDRFDIRSFAEVPCGNLSTGMKQKVSIARAIVHDPPVLIMDEPTTGLDVLVAQTFLRFIEQARADNRCVLFSTHIMSEAERLCDRIAIVHQGRMCAIGTLDELRERTGEHYLERIFIQLVASP